jgi:hypothetical protein
MMMPVLLARRCTVMGPADGRGGGPAGLVPRMVQACSQVSGAGPGAQRFPGSGVEEHQRGFLDADAGSAAAEDLRGDDVAPGQVHLPVLGDHPLDLDRGAGLGLGQRRWPGRPRPGGYQLGQVGGG